MDIQSTLSVIAEVGIGVAGFSSIATAVLSRSKTEQFEARWIQMRMLLITALATVALSYIPMVLSATALNEESIWIVASSLYATWVFLTVAFSIQGYRLLCAQRGSRKLFANLALMLAFLSFSLNFANVLEFRGAWPYLTALGCGLLVTFSQLVSLVRGFWDLRAADTQ